jgi:hypothetical protein
MKLSMNQWLMIGVGAVVLYFVWKKMNEPKKTNGNGAVVTPPAIVTPEEDLSQGDLFNEKFSYSGCR